MLKPGALPVDLGGGVFDSAPYNGSMAAQIESELNLLLAADGLQTLPLDNAQETRDRRRLFVAIARGVVLRGVDLSGAWTGKGDFTGADLRGSDLSSFEHVDALAARLADLLAAR